jgi:hypothetical protein
MPFRWTFRRRPHWHDLQVSRRRLSRMLRRKRRRLRRRSRTAVVVLIILLAAVASLTGGPLPRYLAMRQLAAVLPSVSFTADSARLTRDGTLLISRLAGEATGPAAERLPEDARRLITADSVEIEVDWPGWRFWQARIAAIRIEHPRVRISQSVTDGTLNFAIPAPTAAAPGTTSPGSPASHNGPDRSSTPVSDALAGMTPPLVELVGGEIELGEHAERTPNAPDTAANPGRYTPLANVQMAGWVMPRTRGQEQFTVSVRQVGGDALGLDGRPIVIDGNWIPTSREGTLRMSGVDLSRLTADKVPAAFRPLWESMRLRGRITSSTMRSSPLGLEVELALESVRLSVPIAAARPDLAVSRPPVMEDVSGTLRLVQSSAARGGRSGVEASLTGSLEDLSATVLFASSGLSLDSPYTAQIVARQFRLEREPRLLWLTPDAVRDQLGEFSGPTALVDALITITKAAPTPERPSGLRIAGSLSFTEGVAAYDLFPYTMLDLSGTVSFDDDQVIIRGIRGRGPTGASVLIQGSFNEASAANIEVTLVDVPFDEEVRRTLEISAARPLVDALFSQPAADRLSRAGLLPEGFVSGGRIDSVLVKITRASFDKLEFKRTIEVRFDQTRMLPEAFPLPLVGKDMVLTMRDGDVTLTAHNLTPPGGGRVDVDATLVLPPEVFAGKPFGEILPTVNVTATGVQIDRHLLFALDAASAASAAASSAARAAHPPAGRSPSRSAPLTPGVLLGELGFSGTVDCQATVEPTPPDPAGQSTLTYRAAVTFENATATPRIITDARSIPLGVSASNLSGSLQIDASTLRVDYLGGDIRILRPIAAEAGLDRAPLLQAAADPDGTFAFSGGFILEPGAPAATATTPTIDAEFTLSALNLAAPVEELLRPFDDKLASAIEAVRSTAITSGTVDLDVTARSLTQVDADGTGTRLTAVVRNLSALRTPLAEGTVRVDQDSGALALTTVLRPDNAGGGITLSRATVLLSDFAAELSFIPTGEPIGSLIGRLDGSGSIELAIDPATSPPRLSIPRILDPTSIRLRDGRLGSPVIRSIARRLGGDGLADEIADVDLRGEFTALATLGVTGDATAPEASVTISPRWLAARRVGLDVLLPRVEGSVTVSASGGSIDNLVLDGGLWEVRLDGLWYNRTDEAGRLLWTLSTRIDGEATDLVPSLRAMLPEGTRQTISNLALAAPGGLSLSGGSLELSWPAAALEGDPPSTTAIRFIGPFAFRNMKANPGLAITECSARLDINVDRPMFASMTSLQLSLSEASLIAGGLRITDASGLAESGLTPGELILRSIDGDCFGGRISGSAVIRPAQPAPGSQTADAAAPGNAFAAVVSFGGISLADAVAAIASSAPSPSPAPDTTSSPAAAPASKLAIGPSAVVDGRLSFSGNASDPASQAGEGTIRVSGGRIIDVPLLLPLLSLSNLQLPVGQQLDYFQADFTLDRTTVHFQQLAALSSSVAILGEGSMTLPDLSLDVVVASRRRDVRIPLLTQIFESLRDELLTARVVGTLTSPRLSAETLAGTRQLLGGLAGSRRASARSTEERLADIERQSRRSGTSGATLRPAE